MADDSSYDVTKLNKIGRMPVRGHYDHETVHAIIRAAPVVHVGFVDDGGLPQVVPMVAALDESEDGLFVLLHGYHAARFVKQTSEKGTPLCVTATFIDGLVLALAAFHHSTNYRSATLHGFTDPIAPEDTKARERAARLVVESVLPGRWEGCRQPTAAEYTSTGFIRMRVETGSAKVRTGGPNDDKADLEDKEMTSRVWAGVVPITQHFGAPEPAGTNKAPLPSFITVVEKKKL